MRPRLIAMAIVTHRAAARPRAYVRVKGPDAEEFLQRMLSNDVDAGRRRLLDALLLTPKARLVAPLRVWRRGADDFLLLTEPELGDVRPLDARCARASRRSARSSPRSTRRRSCSASPTGSRVSFRERSRCSTRDSSATLDDEELERARIETRVPAWGKELDEIDPPRRGRARPRRTSRSRRVAIRGRSRSRGCTTAVTRTASCACSTSTARDPATRSPRREGRRPRDERRRGRRARLRADRGAGRRRGRRRRRGRLRAAPPFLMKLIWPLVSSTAHLMSSSDSICWSRA